tara:strand:- start:1594 stop:1818 length:225 start_codon:yes stop_codon:yes gene_type:complete
MRFKKFNSEEQVRDTIILKMMKNRVRKNNLALELGLSYPTVLSKLDRPFSFKVSELLVVCSMVNIDINELLIKY